MFCPNCGTSLEPGSSFCGNCGCKIEEGAAAAVQPTVDAPQADAAPEPELEATAQPAEEAPQAETTAPQAEAAAQPVDVAPQADAAAQQVQEEAPAPEPEPEPAPEPEPVAAAAAMSYDVAPTPVSSNVTPVRTDRDIVMFILLSIVTCGIYSYWYVYKMAQDSNIVCDGDGESTPGLVAYICLSLLTCGIYSIYWEYKLAKRLDANAPRYGVTLIEGASDVLLWLLLGVFLCTYIHYVGTNIVIKNLNTLAKSYNDYNGVTYVRQ